jgi:hypothetical protein
MKKLLVIGTLFTALFMQCGKDTNPYLIENGKMAGLTTETRMMQIDSIFANDSIVRLNPIESALGTQGEVEIYEKGGKKLLLLSPEDESDPNSVISNIQIFDERYATDKGLNIGSTFADIKANYEIEAIENAINSVVIFLKNSEVFITIDKKLLPESIRYNFNAKVEATQIPDTATFKYFMVGWYSDMSESDTGSEE